MRKRKYFFIALFLGLLIVLLAVTNSYINYIKHQERLAAARRHLLCEVLKPGMSEDEVLGILHQAGEFTMNRGEWMEGSTIELGINFTDPKGKDLYGSFDLRLFDYKYAQAYISSFDYFEIICDFSQVIKSPTEMPKPVP